MKNVTVVSWFDKSTMQHLRLPFSFFLMPVFMFALSQAENIHWGSAILAFLILHGLIFPASNGYNSYQDHDEGSIGGLKHPPKTTKNLFHATMLMDISAILLSLLISPIFCICVFIFVIVSHAYSYRKLRLKKYPVRGFLTVFIFQGAFIFLTVSAAVTNFSPINFFTLNNILCMSVSSLFIGSIYPLTQIYQHESDRKDGVISISYKLGYLGTFLFSVVLFSLATLLLFFYFHLKNQQIALIIFFVLMLPVGFLLMAWFKKVKNDNANANFENAMSMNLMTSVSMNLYFIILLLNHYLSWF